MVKEFEYQTLVTKSDLESVWKKCMESIFWNQSHYLLFEIEVSSRRTLLYKWPIESVLAFHFSVCIFLGSNKQTEYRYREWHTSLMPQFIRMPGARARYQPTVHRTSKIKMHTWKNFYFLPPSSRVNDTAFFPTWILIFFFYLLIKALKISLFRQEEHDPFYS